MGVVPNNKPLMMPPKPAVVFPSIKKLAFKIPRGKKKPDSLAMRVGKLWREAISVDPTGKRTCGKFIDINTEAVPTSLQGNGVEQSE